MKNLEIEFKSQLTEAEFIALVQTFPDAHHLCQQNTYFDTADEQLKKAHCALRLRKFLKDGTGEWTLKRKNELGHLEINFSLTKEACAKAEQKGLATLPACIKKELNPLEIVFKDLKETACLKTERWEKKLNNNTEIMLDKSSYYGYTDYELEMEVKNRELGKQAFEHFLAQHQLSFRPSPNKIQRALTAKKNPLH